MQFAGVIPLQAAAGQRHQGGRVGLNHIGRSAPGMPTALADAELDRGIGRNPQLHRSTGESQPQQRAHCSSGGGQLGRGERFGVGYGRHCCAQLLQIRR